MITFLEAVYTVVLEPRHVKEAAVGLKIDQTMILTMILVRIVLLS